MIKKIKYFFVFLLTFGIILLGFMSPDITSSYFSQQLMNKAEPCDLDAINLDSKEELSVIKRMNLLQKYTSIISLNSNDYDLNQVHSDVKTALSALFSQLEVSIDLDKYMFNSLDIVCNIDQPHETSLLYWNVTLINEASGAMINAIMDAKNNQILSIYVLDNSNSNDVNYAKQIADIFEKYINYLGITEYTNPFKETYDNYLAQKENIKSAQKYYSSVLDSDYQECILWEQITEKNEKNQTIAPNLTDSNIESHLMSVAWSENFFSLN